MNTYEETNKMGREAMDNALKSFSAMTRGFQQIAAETSEFTKRSYEQSAEMIEQLARVRSVDKALEVQNEYAKNAYQAWVSQATKMGEIYADIARETYKPFENTAIGAADTGAQVARQTAQQAGQAADRKAA